MGLRLVDRYWAVWPMLGAAAWLTYVVLSGAGPAVFAMAVGLLSVLLTAAGVRRNRPGRTRAWLLFLAGFGAFTAGDTVTAVNAVVLDRTPFPSWADACYLGGYPVLTVALFRLTRDRRQRNLARFLDAAIFATGIGLVYWVAVIIPIAWDYRAPTSISLVTLGYPTTGVLLLAAVAPLILRSGRRTPSLWLLTVGSAFALVFNAFYSLSPMLDPLAVKVVGGGYLFTYLCFAGAALHPSACDPSPDRPEDRLGPTRLVLLTASTMLAPAVLLTEGLHRRGQVDWLAIGIGSIILFLLVMARLSGFVTTVQRQSGQLETLAMTDGLTDLANRRMFEERLAAAAHAGGTHLLVLDLNGFKEVNDRLGHAIGDRLLRAVAVRLAANLRETDLVARMGGDEFAVLLTGATPETVDAVAVRLAAALRPLVVLDDHRLTIGASIGAASGDGTGDAYELLRRADVAMYAAKRAATGTHHWYSPGLDDQANERIQLAEELRTALETGQLHLVYQPIVSLPDGRTVAVEALIRWQHPQRGLISPATFIPLAEQTGIILDVGAWVLRTACAQAVIWRDTLGAAAPQRISVNVSARQLAEPGFPETVAEVLAWTGLGASNLVVEVTETAVFGGGRAVRAVEQLHELGVKIALDDFGTGHSSLGLLQAVPVDILKVDKSFVDTITRAGRHAVIAGALIQVSDGLGLSAVAEGVETAEQAAKLYELGYRLAQGFHFGRPVAHPDFAGRPGVYVTGAGERPR